MVSAAPGSYRLKFGFIRPFAHTKTLELYCDDKLLEQFNVSSISIGKEYEYSTRPFQIEGRAMILFKIKEGQ
jgi:hypothetical protein